MPRVQVVDMGQDPTMGGIANFAGGFAERFFEKHKQNQNEQILDEILAKYGPDTDPSDLYREVLSKRGLDEDYRRNVLNEVRQYSQLPKFSKKGKERDPLYEANQYVNHLFQGGGNKIPASDRAEITEKILDEVKAGTPVEAASTKHLQDYMNYQQLKNSPIQPPPTPSWYPFGNDEKEMDKSKQELLTQLSALYDQGANTRQRLSELAREAGWKSDQYKPIVEIVLRAKNPNIKSTEVNKRRQEEVDSIINGGSGADAFFQ